MFKRFWSAPSTDTPDKVEKLLSKSLSARAKFLENGQVTRYIDEAIALNRKALKRCTIHHPKRADCLVWLASTLWVRYNHLGGIENIQEAVSLDREALALRPLGHPDRPTSLNNLALNLLARYDQLGGVDDLNEAIDLGQEVLEALQPGHPDRSISLNNLAAHLWGRYKLLGRVEDVNKAVILDREALALCPPDHILRSASLSNLALHLSGRYNRLGGLEDIDEAIVLTREAISLRPPGHPERSITLVNLALHLGTRFKRLGRVEDIDEAIVLDQEALTLCLPGHPVRSTLLNNIALHLSARYIRFGGTEDIEEAIAFDREALVLRPPGHPDRFMSLNNLANNLGLRYNKLGAIEDVDETIFLHKEALELHPPGYPDRSLPLSSLVVYLSARYKQMGDAGDVEEIFHLCSELAERSQTVSASDLHAAKIWVNAAEEFHHSTTVLAYETALRSLVEQLAVLPSLPQHLALLKYQASSLAVDAFSACLRSQSPAKAVELLEQGRGVFWSQLTRLRLPIEDVIASGFVGETLADEFASLTLDIRNTINSPDVGQHDLVCQMNVELQGVVSKIRELPGLSRFLLPLRFSDLQHAASDGPVIIMNASKYSCDALVVFADRDPARIPLEVTLQEVQELTSKLGALTALAKREEVTKQLGTFLRELWSRVVESIADFLLSAYPKPRSRIWWCPTAEFSLLPLHAAGAYKKGAPNFSDLYISSYTPTLGALIRARQSVPSDSEEKRFVAIGQANATGKSKLCSISTELSTVEQCIDGLAAFSRVEGEESCISRVTGELAKNEWVHLACHGLPDKQHPFESAFALHDGHLTIQRIMGCDLKNAEFAFLSACHTTVGDEESPDEVIHLAAAMQFAGFRSVIGTMWAVDDAQANKIVSGFYKHVKDKSGRLDHTRAAGALWRATRTVKDVMLDQRVLYIHIGA